MHQCRYRESVDLLILVEDLNRLPHESTVDLRRNQDRIEPGSIRLNWEIEQEDKLTCCR